MEKLHNVSYTGARKNETAGKKFVLDISDYFFQEVIQKKMELVNFIAVLCDGSTNKSITEHEVIYVIYVDPKTNLPVMKFFKIAALENSQDAPGLKEAIISAFSSMAYVLVLRNGIVLLRWCVNIDSDSGLIRLFQEDYPWLSFIWCFSHRFELSLKDSLSEFFEPIDTLLTHK